MIMFKYLGIAMISCSISMYGAYLSNKISMRSKFRSEMIDFIDGIEMSLKYDKKTLFDIYSSIPKKYISDSGFYDALISGGFENWLKTCDILCDIEKDKLSDFFASIGKSKTADGGISLCQSTKAILIGILDKSEQEDKSKCFLYKKLGLICSLVSAIIFL